MRLRHAFLASAAAVLAVPSANAADALVAAEADPVEYVRVCDAFGSGFFYIPGTETCLRISGEVRARYIVQETASYSRTRLPYFETEDPDWDPTPDVPGFTSEDRDLNRVRRQALAFSLSTSETDRTRVRGRLNIDARTDTEFGTLRSFLRLQGENTYNGDADVGVDQAYLEIGNFFAGYSESAWVKTTNGGASGFGAHGIYDGAYGYHQTNMFQLLFGDGNAFGAVSLEDDGDSGEYVPNVVVRGGFASGGATFYGVVGYDQNGDSDAGGSDVLAGTAEGYEFDVFFGGDTILQGFDLYNYRLGLPPTLVGPSGGGDGQFGVKVGLNADIGSAGNLIVQGYYASGATEFGANLSVGGIELTPEWSILASYRHAFSPTFSGYVSGQYFSDFYAPGGDTGMYVAVDQQRNTDREVGYSPPSSAYSVRVGGQWTPAPQFTVTTEIQYVDFDDSEFVLSSDIGDPDEDTFTYDIDGESEWNFLVEVKRTF